MKIGTNNLEVCPCEDKIGLSVLLVARLGTPEIVRFE